MIIGLLSRAICLLNLVFLSVQKCSCKDNCKKVRHEKVKSTHFVVHIIFFTFSFTKKNILLCSALGFTITLCQIYHMKLGKMCS